MPIKNLCPRKSYLRSSVVNCLSHICSKLGVINVSIINIWKKVLKQSYLGKTYNLHFYLFCLIQMCELLETVASCLMLCNLSSAPKKFPALWCCLTFILLILVITVGVYVALNSSSPDPQHLLIGNRTFTRHRFVLDPDEIPEATKF